VDGYRGPTGSIDRLDCTYLVPADHPDSPAVGFRLDAVARGPLVERFAGALAAVLDPADPTVWVIRHLDVGVTLPITMADGDALARIWAEGIAARIAAVVRGEAPLPPGEVTRYPDRAAYIAAFATDVATGAARDRWEYAPFAGLFAVAPGQAVVSAAAASGVPVVEIVARLARTGRLPAFLAASPPADSAAIWRTCRVEAGAAPPEAGLPAVWAHRAVLAVHGDETPVAALRLLGAVLADPGPRPAADALVTAVDHVVTGSAPRWGSVPGAPGWADLAASGRSPVVPAGEAPARSEPGSPVREWEAASEDTTVPRRPGTVHDGHPAYATAHAGVLLLLPSLLDAGLEEAVRSAAPDPYRQAVLRHRVVLRCLGPQATVAAGDPALRLVAGLDPAGAPPDDLAGASADALAAGMLGALAAQGRLDMAAVAVDTLPDPVSGRPLALLRTVPDDVWLVLGEGPRGRAHALNLLSTAGLRPDSLVDGDASGTGDLHFLGVGRGDAADLAVTVLARAGLRLFARRLLGFGRASAAHLAGNAFGTSGVVSAYPGVVEVVLEPGPLQVVLDLAGLDRLACPLPWLAARLLLRTAGGRW
jgi:hypothetical protein